MSEMGIFKINFVINILVSAKTKNVITLGSRLARKYIHITPSFKNKNSHLPKQML